MGSSQIRYWEHPPDHTIGGIVLLIILCVLVGFACYWWIKQGGSIAARLKNSALQLGFILTETSSDTVMRWNLDGTYRQRHSSIIVRQYGMKVPAQTSTFIIVALRCKLPIQKGIHFVNGTDDVKIPAPFITDPMIIQAITVAAKMDPSFSVNSLQVSFELERYIVNTPDIQRYLNMLSDVADAIENTFLVDPDHE